MRYDVFLRCETHRKVDKEKAEALIGQTWAPYYVYEAGTFKIAQEFIPF